MLGDSFEEQLEKKLGAKYLATEKDFEDDHGSLLNQINIKMEQQMNIQSWISETSKKYSEQ